MADAKCLENEPENLGLDSDQPDREFSFVTTAGKKITLKCHTFNKNNTAQKEQLCVLRRVHLFCFYFRWIPFCVLGLSFYDRNVWEHLTCVCSFTQKR